MSQLTIYKASAGSGKTFTLTRRYLELLFQQKDNYKHILAATFTNKATEEMKERIIAELHLLASGQNSAHREYLLSQLPKITSEDQLNSIAAQTLSSILHDYSRLSVTTIDRFFQKIIRSFAREMNVSSNYNIELDADSVLSKASEQMYFDLDKKGNEQLLQWVTRYAEEQITEGKSWNFTRNITSLSKEFLKEEYKSHSNNSENQLGDFIILNSFLSKITKTQKSIQQEFKTLAEKAIKIAEGYELKALNFKYGKTSGVNFIYNCYKGEIPKEIKKRTLDMSTDTAAWYKASDKCAGDIQAACDAGMFEILNKLILLWAEKYPIYNSIAVVRQNFYSLGVLSDLERQLKRYTDENNLFLLANSNELIAKIIDHSDTPFIYEKTGNNYKHFMIDEFQDTSRLQWDNIKPLINNSMGEGHKSLLVGDVKQSIYRWRNSDWKQLANGIQEST